MANKMNSTKVVTGVVRLSYANVWEPASINGSNPKYSVSLIIPKSDKQTLDAINAAVDAAIKEGVAKFGGKIPNKAALKLPLRDGDTERDDEAYKNSFFVNANSTTKKPRYDSNSSAPQRQHGKPRQKLSAHLCLRCRNWMPSLSLTKSSG